MKYKFLNRRIVSSGKHYEVVNYDIGTNKFCTQFNGVGGFNYFHYVNSSKLNLKAESYMGIYINDELLDVNTKKRVTTGGRLQTIRWILPYGYIELNQYAKEDCIYYKVRHSFKESKHIDIVFDYTRFVDVPTLVATSSIRYEGSNYAYYLSLDGKSSSTYLCLSFLDTPKNWKSIARATLKEVNEEIDNITIPSICDTEMKKCLYLASIFTALENYKEIGEYKCLTAGVNYLTPLRTYYRDSYWTVLALYAEHSYLVKNQIIALAKGINPNGECPSAVKSDYSGFWGGHYDSPCFFVMMVRDYVNETEDNSILDLEINGCSIKELCVRVINKLEERVDSTGLIYKVGPYNKLDWADAVNRNGYVTYDNALYYQALLCLEFISKDHSYRTKANKVKDSINTILWNEDKGYYNNYIDNDFIEDNLSVDTVLTVLFDIVPSNKKERLLDNFEAILYSKNHKDLIDFGVMSCYPFYKKHDRVVSISGQGYTYHNGSNWPYWSGVFAYMLMRNNRDYIYALSSWFTYNVSKGNLTPLEYFTPYRPKGSDLQAWSATSAFALNYCNKDFFKL